MNAQNPEKRDGTILFCDIRNFTSLFDEIDPLEAVDFANSVLAVLGEVVEKFGGTVDRFTGDGFLAHYGFKNSAPDHTAAYCKIETNQLEQTTVLGDTVNLASRLEELTKYFMVDVLVSETVFKKLNETYTFQKMPLKSIKGKSRPVQTYWFMPTNNHI